MMDLGFDTIGNAILICYDRGPLLVTDPWLEGSAYFGSWGFGHEIPAEQMAAIKSVKFVWVSHGHPDHLSPPSLKELEGKKFLLPDHAGNRIYHSFLEQGRDCQVLKNREWVRIGDRTRIMCIADYNQDAVLLVDINGRLVFNKNDADDLGWGSFARNIIGRYEKSFALALSSRFGDADMLNYFDENGCRIPPVEALELGRRNAHQTEVLGAKFFVPFSSMHIYQREDSAWLRPYATTLADYARGFQSDTCQLLPAFMRYDCSNDSYVAINPPETPRTIHPPEAFGDNWSDLLEKADCQNATRYFRSFEHLQSFLGFVNLRVGGKDNIIDINPRRSNCGVTFEVPRNSLMAAIEYQIFDDLLIGNFMRVTLHGEWKGPTLYPDFAPYVPKYGDNGFAKSEEELEKYMKAYRTRAFFDFVKHRLELRAEALYREWVPDTSFIHRMTKQAYWHYKKTLR